MNGFPLAEDSDIIERRCTKERFSKNEKTDLIGHRRHHRQRGRRKWTDAGHFRREVAGEGESVGGGNYLPGRIRSGFQQRAAGGMAGAGRGSFSRGTGGRRRGDHPRHGHHGLFRCGAVVYAARPAGAGGVYRFTIAHGTSFVRRADESGGSSGDGTDSAPGGVYHL